MLNRVAELLKLLIEASVLEGFIGCMAGFYGAVHCEIAFRERAIPDFVVAAALPMEATPVTAENALELAGVVRHSSRTAADGYLLLVKQRHRDFFRPVVTQQAV